MSKATLTAFINGQYTDNTEQLITYLTHQSVWAAVLAEALIFADNVSDDESFASPSTITVPTTRAVKAALDAIDAGFNNEFTANVNANNNKIFNLGAGTAATDSVNKGQMDAADQAIIDSVAELTASAAVLSIASQAIVWDAATAATAFLLLDVNVTSFTVNGHNDGRILNLLIKQDGTGGRTLAAPAGYTATGTITINSGADSYTWMELIKTGSELSYKTTPGLPSGGIGVSIFTDTYANIETLRAGSQLEQGAFYVISDYATKYTQPVSLAVKTGVAEPLIIQAVSTSEFSPHAISVNNPTDIIEYDFKDTGGALARTGRILFRHDPVKDLSAHYDWRSVQFIRYRNLGVSAAPVSVLDPVFNFDWRAWDYSAKFYSAFGMTDFSPLCQILDFSGVVSHNAGPQFVRAENGNPFFQRQLYSPDGSGLDADEMVGFNKVLVFKGAFGSNDFTYYDYTPYDEYVKGTPYSDEYNLPFSGDTPYGTMAVTGDAGDSVEYLTFKNASDGGDARRVHIGPPPSGEELNNIVLVPTQSQNLLDSTIASGCQDIHISGGFDQSHIGPGSFNIVQTGNRAGWWDIQHQMHDCFFGGGIQHFTTDGETFDVFFNILGGTIFYVNLFDQVNQLEVHARQSGSAKSWWTFNGSSTGLQMQVFLDKAASDVNRYWEFGPTRGMWVGPDAQLNAFKFAEQVPDTGDIGDARRRFWDSEISNLEQGFEINTRGPADVMKRPWRATTFLVTKEGELNGAPFRGEMAWSNSLTVTNGVIEDLTFTGAFRPGSIITIRQAGNYMRFQLLEPRQLGGIDYWYIKTLDDNDGGTPFGEIVNNKELVEIALENSGDGAAVELDFLNEEIFDLPLVFEGGLFIKGVLNHIPPLQADFRTPGSFIVLYVNATDEPPIEWIGTPVTTIKQINGADFSPGINRLQISVTEDNNIEYGWNQLDADVGVTKSPWQDAGDRNLYSNFYETRPWKVFINTGKNEGWWDKLSHFWLFAASNSGQQLVDLKTNPSITLTKLGNPGNNQFSFPNEGLGADSFSTSDAFFVNGIDAADFSGDANTPLAGAYVGTGAILNGSTQYLFGNNDSGNNVFIRQNNDDTSISFNINENNIPGITADLTDNDTVWMVYRNHAVADHVLYLSKDGVEQTGGSIVTTGGYPNGVDNGWAVGGRKDGTSQAAVVAPFTGSVLMHWTGSFELGEDLGFVAAVKQLRISMMTFAFNLDNIPIT